MSVNVETRVENCSCCPVFSDCMINDPQSETPHCEVGLNRRKLKNGTRTEREAAQKWLLSLLVKYQKSLALSRKSS